MMIKFKYLCVRLFELDEAAGQLNFFFRFLKRIIYCYLMISDN